MLPAAIVIAGIASAEVPPQPPQPPIAITTRWSLSAGVAPAPLIGPVLPLAGAAAADGQPVGPGQVIPPPVIPPAAPQPEVEVLSDEELAQPERPLEDDFVEALKPADDPLEGFNRISFDVSMALDKVLIRPAAMAYQTIIPKPARDGVRNALSNLGEPLVFLNDLLQLKPKRALKTLARFLLNSVLGIGGLFDVAKEKKFQLRHHSNSFGNTLGYYGVKPGPYIYLPLLGPTTVRDFLGREEGRVLGAVGYEPVPDGLGFAPTIVAGLDQRARNDTELKALLEDAIDPYATFRETWLQDREGEIRGLKAPDGKDPGSVATLDPLDDPLIDPAPPQVDETVAEPESRMAEPQAETPADDLLDDPLTDPLDDPLEDPAAMPAE